LAQLAVLRSLLPSFGDSPGLSRFSVTGAVSVTEAAAIGAANELETSMPMLYHSWHTCSYGKNIMLTVQRAQARTVNTEYGRQRSGNVRTEAEQRWKDRAHAGS